MKKLLVVLLALAMVFGLATTAFAYTDEAGQDSAAVDSSYYLSALGVVNGYSDGSYGYDATITRAEFAKIACGIAGLADSADALANTSSRYADVSVGSWYTGWVNLATSQGYLQGYPDGTFKPNATISMQEVATVLLRIAGYDDNLAGSWPYDYIAQAGKVDLTDDVTFVANAAATRAGVAIMAANLLDVEVMYWDTDKDRFLEVDEDADVDNTVLNESFGAIAIDDVYFANGPDSQISAWTVDDFDDMSISLNLYADVSDAAAGTDLFNFDLADDYYISGGLCLADLNWAKADLAFNDDDEVIYIDVKSTCAISDDVELTATLDDVEETAADVDLSIDGKTYGLANDMDEYADLFVAQLGATDGEYEAAIDYMAYCTDEDGDLYAIMDMTGYAGLADEAPAIVDEYDADSEEITMLDGDDIDLEDQDYLIIKGCEFVEASALAQGDVIYNLNLEVADYNGDADMILVVGGAATGTLTKANSSGKITIGGYAYAYNYDDAINGGVTDASYVTDGIDGTYAEFATDDLDGLEDLFSTEVSYVTYLNPYVVAYVIGDADAASDYVYGIVTDYTEGSHSTDISSITVYNQDGETVEYDLDDAYTAETSGAEVICPGAYVEFKLNSDGEVSNFDAVDVIFNPDETTDAIDTEENISGSKIKIGTTWYTLADDAIIMEAVLVDTLTDLAAFDPETDDWADYYDEANVVSADDVLAADEFAADGYYIADTSGSNTITRLYIVNSSLGGGEDYGVISDVYYDGGDADMYEIIGDAAYELDGVTTAVENDFVAYEAASDIAINSILISFENNVVDAGDITVNTDDLATLIDADDIDWVINDGTLDTAASIDGASFDVVCEDVAVDDDVVTINDEYFYLTDSTVVYCVDEDGDVTAGDINDVDDGSTIISLVDTDDESDLLIVFVVDTEYVFDVVD